MVREVEIENYRCLREVRFGLEPLTVLVGPNGSGKSSVLSALQFQYRGVGDYWGKDSSRVLRIKLTQASGKILEWSSGPLAKSPPPATLLLHLDPSALRDANQVAHAASLEGNGGNLPNVLSSLGRRRLDDLAKHFSELIPHFSDVDVRPMGSGTHAIMFQDRWNSSVWYSAHEVSEGTMLLLAFLALAYQPFSPELLCIEEPERGLHPYLLRQLVEHLRSLSTGGLGNKPIQIVLATHSAELLDHVEPREVRFLSRSPEDGSVQVEHAPVDEPNWKRAFEEYQGSVGALWLSGGLGGVPGG